MASGSTFFNDRAMTLLVNHDKEAFEEFMSKLRVFHRDREKALRWVWQYVVMPNESLTEKYMKFNQPFERKEYPNTVTDQFEAIIKEYGWPAFRLGLVDFAQRQLNYRRYVGLDIDRATKLLATFESLYREFDTKLESERKTNSSSVSESS